MIDLWWFVHDESVCFIEYKEKFFKYRNGGYKALPFVSKAGKDRYKDRYLELGHSYLGPSVVTQWNDKT